MWEKSQEVTHHEDRFKDEIVGPEEFWSGEEGSAADDRINCKYHVWNKNLFLLPEVPAGIETLNWHNNEHWATEDAMEFTSETEGWVHTLEKMNWEDW